MKLRKMSTTMAAGLLATLALAACSSPSDPAAAWLLALAQPTGSGTTGGSTTTSPDTSADFQLNVTPTSGSADFLFNTTADIQVNVTVLTPFAAAAGSRVRIYNTANTGQNVYFNAVADANGNVTGTFTINATTSTVTLEVTYQGQTYTRDYNITSVTYISGRISITGDLGQHIVVILDRDGDGIPDDQDQYPDDATRATTVKYPENGGYFTIAFEDLYPKPGDADFNDYVTRVSYEEDLNAKGEVARIRAHYTHVAKGAGYTHLLKLAVPGSPDMSYHLVRRDAAGATKLDTSGTLVAGGALEILPSSGTTIAQSNAAISQSGTLVPGWSADVEFILNTPTSTNVMQRIPYDTFIHVNNTNKDVHFAGLYSVNGVDSYLDKNGFPWALMIPGDWHWPFESQNIHQAYLDFGPWYTSKGTQYADWYVRPVAGKVFAY